MVKRKHIQAVNDNDNPFISTETDAWFRSGSCTLVDVEFRRELQCIMFSISNFHVHYLSGH